MGRAFIETVNSSPQNVLAGGSVSPGAVVRRFGCNMDLQGDGIAVCGSGYYQITASVVVAPEEEGEITAALYRDGVEIPGAFATETVASAGDVTTLTIPTAIRECCCDGTSSITCKLSADCSVSNYVFIGDKK